VCFKGGFRSFPFLGCLFGTESIEGFELHVGVCD
jgi:hypothetical protein